MKKQKNNLDLDIEQLDLIASQKWSVRRDIFKAIKLRAKEFKSERKTIRLQMKRVEAQKKIGLIDDKIIDKALAYEAN